MNENLKKYGIPVILVIIIVYFIFKSSSGGSKSSTSTINRLVPLQGENNTQEVNRDNLRGSAFTDLASIAGQKIAQESRAQSEMLQFQGLKETLISGQEIERIKTGLQKELGLQGLEAVKLQIAGVNEANRITSADRRYDIDQQLVAQDRMLTAQKDIFNLQANSAFQTLMAQINSVKEIGAQYRGQSLERQGTILNALSAIWGQNQVYSYESAFGGPRGPGIFQQILDAATSLIQPIKIR